MAWMPRPVAQDVIHDRHDVGQALAQAGAAGENVRAAFLGLQDGVTLVGVQEQRLPRVVRVGFVDLEEARTLRMQRAVARQSVDRGRA